MQVNKFDRLADKIERNPLLLIYGVVWVVFLLMIAVMLADLTKPETANAEKTTAQETTTQETTTETPTTAAEPVLTYYPIKLSHEWQDVIRGITEAYNVPVEIVYGVMYKESRYDFLAENGDNIGIMQVNTINLAELQTIGVTELNDPLQNIEAGVYLLSKYYNKYGDWNKALVCYNCGEAGAAGIMANGYSRAVIQYAQDLNGNFG